MTNPVTIDHLDLTTHVRWAKDQSWLDPTLIKDACSVHPHLEQCTLTQSFLSEVHRLFALQPGPSSWATFFPPPNAVMQSKRFYTHRVCPYVILSFSKAVESAEKPKEETEEEEQQERGSKAEALLAYLEEVMSRTSRPKKKRAQLEREKFSLYNMFQTLTRLDRWLEEINARSLQYQRG